MNRAEGLETLKEMAFTAYGHRSEALDMAISALSDYDKMQKISLDLAFKNDELMNELDSIKNGTSLSADGDLISRQAVLEVVRKWFDKIQLNGDICLDGIVSLPSVENKSEWIPVSERLPDNNVRVLCSAISTSISGGYTRFVGCCNNGYWFVQTDAETVSYPRQYKVTAWCELPEPYKAEKGGNE